MNKKFLNTTFIVLLALLICKLFAFLQEMVIAAKLGATVVGDAFNMVFSIQQTIYPMLSVGISQIFFPEYKKLLYRNKKHDANVFASYSIIIFTSFSIAVVLCLLYFTDSVVNLAAPGFNAEQHIRTVNMIKLSSISYTFICTASVVSCILMANGHFFVSEIRGALSHIPIIIAALLFYDRFGMPALAIAITIAGILRLLIQIPFLRLDYEFSLSPRLEKKYIGDLLKLLPTSLISSGINQLNTFVDKMLASSLAVGSVSCLNYGGRIFSVLQELSGNIIATSSYPEIVECTALQKKSELDKMIYEIINAMLMITVPLTICGLTFSKYIVDILFVRGKFTIGMGQITSSVFSMYIISLPLSSLHGIINNIFFANKNTKTPMIINGINLFLNIILNVLFMNILGIAGLALATTVSSTLCITLNLIYIRRYVSINYKKTLINVIKIAISIIVSLLFSFVVVKIIRIGNSFLMFSIFAFFTAILYLCMIKLLKIDVVEIFVRKIFIKRKL